MDELSIRRLMQSEDPDLVLDALSALGGMREAEPAPETLELAARHLTSSDPDVRLQAVMATAIHWAYVPTFGRLLIMAWTDQDDDVVGAVLSGISRLAGAEPPLLPAALGFFVRFCFAAGRPLTLKNKAFIEAKYAAGDIKAQDSSRAFLDGYPDKPDRTWFLQKLGVLGA